MIDGGLTSAQWLSSSSSNKYVPSYIHTYLISASKLLSPRDQQSFFPRLEVFIIIISSSSILLRFGSDSFTSYMYVCGWNNGSLSTFSSPRYQRDDSPSKPVESSLGWLDGIIHLGNQVTPLGSNGRSLTNTNLVVVRETLQRSASGKTQPER